MADSVEMVTHVQVLFSPVSHVSSSFVNVYVSVYIYVLFKMLSVDQAMYDQMLE